MKQFPYLLLLLLSFFHSYAQNVVSSLNIPLKSDRDFFQVVDDSNKKVTLFLSDYKNVNAFLLNEKLEITDSLKTEKKETAYNTIIGYAKKENLVKIIWSNPYNKKLYAQSFNFITKKAEGKIIDLPYEKERIIQKFHFDNKFYLVTSIKNTNDIKFYIFDDTDIITEKKVNLDGFKFYLSNFQKSTLYGVLGENMLPFEPAFALQHIDTESPVSLTYASKKRKSYLSNGKFIITLDTNQAYTLLISIDLNDYKATEKIFKSDFLPAADYEKPKSNSFLLDDKLFCVKNNDTQFIFTVKNLNDEELSKQKIFSGHPIAFQNYFTDESENKARGFNSEKFIDAINQLNCGVSVYKINSHYQLTIGGVSEITDNTGMMMGGMFGLTGALLYSALSNSTLDNFNSNQGRYVMEFESRFDENGKHVPGNLTKTAFDKIQNHISTGKLESPTLFKFGKDFYLGTYIKKTKEYQFIRFTE